VVALLLGLRLHQRSRLARYGFASPEAEALPG
jgi:hypothetical protein